MEDSTTPSRSYLRSLSLGAHIVSDPLQQHAHKRVLIKIGDVFLVLVPHGIIFRLFVHHVFQKRIHQTIQILFQKFQRNGTINILDKSLILFRQIKHRQKPLLPGSVRAVFFQHLLGIFYARPLHKIVNILKMVIKRLAVNAAVVRNILHRDFIQFLFAKQLFQRRGNRPLGNIAHDCQPCAPPEFPAAPPPFNIQRRKYTIFFIKSQAPEEPSYFPFFRLSSAATRLPYMPRPARIRKKRQNEPVRPTNRRNKSYLFRILPSESIDISRRFV